jgi:ligand-binding SRPBCC domain-containing protein
VSVEYSLRVWTRHLEPPELVWAHKTDPEMLAAEFRPLVSMTMSEGDRRAMEQSLSSNASLMQLELRIAPMGLRWPMELELLEPGRAYRDTSRNRIYRQWEHEHRLIPASDGCLYVDEIRFVPALPGHLRWARLTARLMQHRHRRASEWLKGEKGSVGVAALRRIGQF